MSRALKYFARRCLANFLGLLALSAAVLGFGLAIGAIFGEGELWIRACGFIAGLALASAAGAALFEVAQ